MTVVSTVGTAPRLGSRLRVRLALAGLAACGIAALAWSAWVQPLPRLVYNPSNSVPVGWYRIGPADALRVGAIVLTTLPPAAAALAAQRRYLPARVPLLKRVGAVAPQHVCIFDALVWIDGVPVAAALPADRLGRPLPSWPHCRRLEPGELFLLSSTNLASFDSRYFGPVSASAVIGVAHPVWPEKRP